MARIRYYYDTKTCKYVRVRTRPVDVVTNVLAFLLVSVAFGALFSLTYDRIFGSPLVSKLRKENQELLMYYDIVNQKSAEMQSILSALQQRDDNVYRVIFEAEPIPPSVRAAGVGGAERYQDILDEGLQRQGLILTSVQKLDQLKKQLYIQSKSYDEIAQLVEQKKDMLAAIPAVRPIRSRELKRMASGYGRRIDPIYKTVKMHWGMDFSARSGTEIIATGEGKVIKAGRNGGYGKCVVIDHGFGYQTLYGHMSKITVKKGQRVSRGDAIGAVGSTGKSTGPHLHYEVIKDGKKVNPINFYYNDLTPSEYEEMVQLAEHSNQSLD